MRNPIVILALLSVGCGNVDSKAADAGPSDSGPGSDSAAAVDASLADARPRPDAATICDTANGNTIFINTNGGTYDQGAPTSPASNTSSIIQSGGTLSGWAVSSAVKAEMVQCLRETFRPFNVVVTETEPAAEPYIEIAVTSSSSMDDFFPFAVPSIGQQGCSPNELDSSIAFVFGDFGNDPLTICRSAASQYAFTRGLSRVTEVCQDVMTFSLQCTQQVPFIDAAQTCGGAAAMPCFCNQAATQNSAQLLFASLGACPP